MDNPFSSESPHNFLSLERPLVFFDLETTGTSVTQDRIIELCAVRLHPDGTRSELLELFHPTIPIPAGASAVHGICDKDVADKPTFAERARELAAFFDGCDLGGFNVKRFDLPLLMQEFHRCKLYPIKSSQVKVVDAMSLYQLKERRDLSSAVRFYCQREHDGAHSAKADVLATIDVLKQQLLRYDDLQPNVSYLHNYLDGGKTVDPSGKFIRDESGAIVFHFGIHKGKPALSEPKYLEWMETKGDFAIDTIMAIRRIRKNAVWQQEIRTWLKEGRILQDASLPYTLYSVITFRKNIAPFLLLDDGTQATLHVTGSTLAPLPLRHEDAYQILSQELEEFFTRSGVLDRVKQLAS